MINAIAVNNEGSANGGSAWKVSNLQQTTLGYGTSLALAKFACESTALFIKVYDESLI